MRPLAILATPMIAAEIALDEPGEATGAGRRTGRIGDYPVEVLMTSSGPRPRPAAVLISPWIFENLTLFTRKLWTRR